MGIKETPVKIVFRAIEEYYEGQRVNTICKNYDITVVTFNYWLADYKEMVLELMKLKIENERLRNLLIEFIISRPTSAKKKRNNKP